MIQKPQRSYAIYTLIALAFAAIVLFAAGFWLCNSISIVFEHLQRIRVAQSEAQSALALQVREDVELQEFARFRVRFFHDPQLAAFASSELRRAKVAAATCCGHKADRAFSAAQQTATTWKERVAGPILAHPPSELTPQSFLTATFGKVLIDQYSAELSEIESFLDAEAVYAASDVKRAVNVTVCIFAGLVVVFASAAFYYRSVVVSERDLT